MDLLNCSSSIPPREELVEDRIHGYDGLETPLGADPEDGRACIALFEPVCAESDPALAAVLVALTDTVELSLACLDRYAIQRLPPADPSADLKRIRAYCAENRIDQAIGETASARKGGGYSFRLVVYDRLKDSVTLIREAASIGALDMFDVTDALVASLLDGLSGSHLLFGSLEVESEPPGAAISVNGRDAGAPAVIEDGVTASVVLKLVRSAGRLRFGVPQDASLAIIGQDNTDSRVGQASSPTSRRAITKSRRVARDWRMRLRGFW